MRDFTKILLFLILVLISVYIAVLFWAVSSKKVEYEVVKNYFSTKEVVITSNIPTGFLKKREKNFHQEEVIIVKFRRDQERKVAIFKGFYTFGTLKSLVDYRDDGIYVIFKGNKSELDRLAKLLNLGGYEYEKKVLKLPALSQNTKYTSYEVNDIEQLKEKLNEMFTPKKDEVLLADMDTLKKESDLKNKKLEKKAKSVKKENKTAPKKNEKQEELVKVTVKNHVVKIEKKVSSIDKESKKKINSLKKVEPKPFDLLFKEQLPAGYYVVVAKANKQKVAEVMCKVVVRETAAKFFIMKDKSEFFILSGPYKTNKFSLLDKLKSLGYVDFKVEKF